MNKRYHILDTMAATFEDYGNSINLSDEDVKHIKELKDKKRSLVYRKRTYSVISKKTDLTAANLEKIVKKTDFWSNPSMAALWDEMKKVESTAIRFDVLYTHETGNLGRLTYTLYKKKSGEWKLSFIGNPTSLINGHNTGPAAVYKKPGFKENLILNRVGFEFFFEVVGFKPSDLVCNELRDGKIMLQNVQFAIHVPSKNKRRDMTALKHLYCRPMLDHTFKGRYVMFGEVMGLKPIVSAEYEGLMLKGFSGKDHPTFTVSVYDKALENKSVKKRGLSQELKLMTEKSLRLDITLHQRYIDILAGLTLTKVKKIIEDRTNAGKTVNRYYLMFIDEMKRGKTSTALSLCMIMHILPREDDLTFAQFILRKILCNEMYLDKIVQVRQSRLQLNAENFDDTSFAIYRSWKKAKTIDEWKIKKKKLTDKYGHNKLYRSIKNLENVMDVSMDIPFTFWNQIRGIDSIYGMTSSDFDKYSEWLNEAATNQPTEKKVKLLDGLVDGQQRMQKRRSYLIETFLKPIGILS